MENNTNGNHDDMPIKSSLITLNLEPITPFIAPIVEILDLISAENI